MTAGQTTITQTETTRTVTRRRPRRWPWVLGGLLLLGGIGGALWQSRQGTADASVTAVTSTQVVTPGVLRVSVSGPGTLEANATRTVGADLTATVGQVPAVGERVTRGQLITTLTSDTVEENVRTAQLNLDKARASLDATRASQASSTAQRQSSAAQAQAAVTEAEAAVVSAQRTLRAQRELYAVGAISAQTLGDAQSALDKAQLTLSSARTSASAALTQARTGQASDAENLRSAQIAVQQAQSTLDTAQKARSDLKVYAPISGVISNVAATDGTVVTAGSTILTLMDDTTLNLPVQVDETEIAGVRVGQSASVTLDAFEDQTFTGKVVRVSPGATQSSGISVFTATVQLDNGSGQLRSGMTAEAEIIQSEARGLLVPSKAIQTVRSRSYVQVPAAAGGDPERVRVETGATDGTNTVVTDGLEAGQEVIVPGRVGAAGSGSAAASGGRQQGGVNGPPGGFGGGQP